MLRNLWIVFCFSVAVDGFSSRSSFGIGRLQKSTDTRLRMSNFEHEFSEMLAPEFKYELVPLPDSMLDTTLFVGNLDEFVYDKDLSDLFQSVSVLHSLPACVVRKPNFETLRYGFVTFPTVEEKENAILRYHGSVWKGKCIKVEPILDHPKSGRVRVPEQFASYVSGSLKKTRDGRVNSLRRARNDDAAAPSKGRKKQKAKMMRQSNQPKRGNGNASTKLSWKDQAEFERSARKGYVTLDKRDNSNKRVSTSSLVRMHRTWCDTRAKPQIIYCKAAGSGQLDHVMIDLSTLRKTGMFDKVELVEQCLLQYKLDILEAASTTGLELRRNEDCRVKEDSEEEACDTMEDFRSDSISEYGITEEDLTVTNWSSKPKISRLPVVTLGVFVGERANTKAMARALAQLWQLPEELEMMDSGLNERPSSSNNSKGGAWVSDRSKYKNERRRGGRHRR